MQEDIQRKSIVLTTKAAKLTGRGLAKLMAAALRQMRKSRDAPKIGKQTVKQLARQGGKLENIEITDDNIKSFDRVARKYGVDFALKQDATETPPRWYVFFKARDAETMTAAFNEFTRDTLRREKKPSVLETMKNLRELTKNAVLDRTKHKERSGPEL